MEMMDAVIKKEKEIIGKAAITIARRVEGLSVDDSGKIIDCTMPEDDAFSRLVDEYVKMMGDVTFTIVSMAIAPIIAPHCPKLKPPYRIDVRITK